MFQAGKGHKPAITAIMKSMVARLRMDTLESLVEDRFQKLNLVRFRTPVPKRRSNRRWAFFP